MKAAALFLVEASLLTFSAASFAGTLRVPSDYSTIQAALDAASILTVDSVVVAPGTYHETVRFNGKSVRLVSESGPSETMIMAASAADSAVVFANGERAEAVISGFTITNSGNGIYVGAASATIVSNVIVNCGSGITFQFASSTLRGNRIARCSGAGIILGAGINPLIEGNLIEENGGGIDMNSAGSPLIRNNRIRRNQGHGINMINQSDADIFQNIISENAAFGIVSLAWISSAPWNAQNFRGEGKNPPGNFRSAGSSWDERRWQRRRSKLPMSKAR